MSLNRNIIKNLFEDTSVDTDNLAQEIFSTYYDETTNKLKPESEEVIADRCNNDINLINEVKSKLEDLIPDSTKEETDISPELKKTGEDITKILNNYGIKATFINAKVGPRVTQYEFELAPGTKISEVSNLNKEIAMGLAATQVSIGPVEGSTLLGIQVPNKESTNVDFNEVLEKSDKSGVSLVLGKDTNGDAVSADILKLQHILIGGTTGSGKSACINSMICSIISSYSPDQVKLVLIDPKKVELSAYKNIPHLAMPIVTDPQEAANTLDDLVELMDKRYTTFEKVGVKNIESYNNLVNKYNESGKSINIMPYIIVIIDELADLMQTAGKQVESSIQRLTQLARAAGIHLIVATQRPSVDVVTGVIKSNINSRIAFATPSSVDSRTILDQGGAEKLLGKGDMLYKPLGSTNAKRVQGAFLSDEEVENIINSVSSKYGSNKREIDTPDETTSTNNDENYEKALNIIKKLKRISAANLQIELGIPFSEASRIIKKLEANGIISAQKGNKGRKVNKAYRESEEITFDKDVVDKVYNQYEKEKPRIKEEIVEEFREFIRSLYRAGLKKEDIEKLPEVKAYSDAIKDPEDIWCECSEEHDTDYKPDGEVYLGVSKHAYICKKCKKYKQIG